MAAERTGISQKITAVLVYGRLPLVFGGLLCAVAVMWSRDPILYTIGVILLFISMSFDLVDGWFAARFYPHPQMAQLADRILDKLVYSIIFPLVSVGAMWRLLYVVPDPKKTELLHAMLVLFLTVTVLVRDNFAHFMRGVAQRFDQDIEYREFIRLRTVVAAPVGALLYAYVFHVPDGPPSFLYSWISRLAQPPLRTLFFIEIVFLIVNAGSMASLVRRYGSLCLQEMCLGNETLRRGILIWFPNALTVMNAMMGLLAVFFAAQGRVREASLFLLGAALFDKLDGAVARRLGLTEPLPGAEPRSVSMGGLLDDIADAVSFCIAPAWIFFILMSDYPDAAMQELPYGWVALAYALAGVGRLVYFTLDKAPIPGFFKGMPTPAGALLVIAPMVIFNHVPGGTPGLERFWALFSFGLLIATALIMNAYPIRYLHIGRFMSRHPWVTRSCLLLLLCSLLTPFYGHVLLILMLLYALSPLVTGRIDPQDAARETRSTPA
ncbi:MAG: CDP-alcohol phosphatidyltransferase family protein [Desulfobacterales bacterium]